jgi:acetyl-CoA synthetase
MEPGAWSSAGHGIRVDHPDEGGPVMNRPDGPIAIDTGAGAGPSGSVAWTAARAELDGLPGGRGLNIAHEAVDRHVADGLADRVALRWLRPGAREPAVEVTYGELAEQSDRFAAGLEALGVTRGDAVFVLLDRVPELYVAALGTWKHLSVLSPLFPLNGPEPVRQRLTIGRGRVLVTTEALYRQLTAPVRAQLPDLAHVILVGSATVPADIAGAVTLDELMDAGRAGWTVPDTDPSAPAIVHFTSGTTGTPKGAVHVHEAVVAIHATAAVALDLHPGDVYWCTADPGSVTATAYGIIAPLTQGATVVVDQGELDAERWFGILGDEGVEVWYTSPTALRVLRQAHDTGQRLDLPHLRYVASVGEPLEPSVVSWALQSFGVPVHDTWWQTETGAIMIADTAHATIHPGSMGHPLPGVTATILARDPSDDQRPLLVGEHVVEVSDPAETGHLALRAGWPSMFRAYVGEPERYRSSFVDGWYVTGDLAHRDADGTYWFVARADDLIKTAGHLVGPAEVEQVLLAQPAVRDAAVIGVPDPVAGEVVKAFVALAPGYEPMPGQAREIIGYARTRLGPAVAPRSVAFEPTIPHNRSGTTMRRVLRQRERGAP